MYGCERLRCKSGNRGRQKVLRARRGPTIRMWSLDARSRGPSAHPLQWEVEGVREKKKKGSLAIPDVLAQRAASEGPRWTRARWETTRMLHTIREKSEKMNCLIDLHLDRIKLIEVECARLSIEPVPDTFLFPLSCYFLAPLSS